MKEVNNQVAKVANEAAGAVALEKVLIEGDLSKLNSKERVQYCVAVCNSLGLNPLTKPFEYINLQGKLTLYARRDCTEQLRKINGVSISITSREKIDDCYIVTAKATDKTGRTDESIGSVDIAGLKGEKLSNAIMKAETKAKRRVTLSLCGLGMLDEAEVPSVVNVSPADNEQAAQELHSLCKNAAVDTVGFIKFHGISRDKPQTLIDGINNFSLLRQQYIDHAATNSNI